MSLKEKVGTKFGPIREIITQERITHFSKAVGALVSNEAALTFMTVLRRSELGLSEILGIELAGALHGEQQYIYHHPIHAGMVLLATSHLSNVLEKKTPKGKIAFLLFETLFEEEASQKAVSVSRTTLIVKKEVL